MSDLIVKVQQIKEVKNHQNADNLDIIVIGGWQCIVGRNQFKTGDEAIFIPVDSMIEWTRASEWKVDTYLSGFEKRGTPGHKYEKAGRVKAINLRNEPSLGVVIPNIDNFPMDTDVKEAYGIFKYEEPERALGGRSGTQTKNSSFWRAYTNIEAARNYEDIFTHAEPVLATEKIHGENCLHSDTLIMLANGEEILIKDVQRGMVVTVWDGNDFNISKVEGVICQLASEKWLKLYLDSGRVLVCTENHYILTKNRSWVMAVDLTEEDDIVSI